jgi:hypothetical protein
MTDVLLILWLAIPGAIPGAIYIWCVMWPDMRREERKADAMWAEVAEQEKQIAEQEAKVGL